MIADILASADRSNSESRLLQFNSRSRYSCSDLVLHVSQ
jgi:hypothetical protein